MASRVVWQLWVAYLLFLFSVLNSPIDLNLLVALFSSPFIMHFPLPFSLCVMVAALGSSLRRGSAHLVAITRLVMSNDSPLCIFFLLFPPFGRSISISPFLPFPYGTVSFLTLGRSINCQLLVENMELFEYRSVTW